VSQLIEGDERQQSFVILTLLPNPTGDIDAA
jgi:hypothetical protein